MRNYEILIIIKPNLDMEEADRVISTFDGIIKDFGGKIENTEKMGRKKLAYEIGNFKDGFYLTLQIDFPEDKVSALKRTLTLNENVIRFMVIENSKSKTKA